jgi:hypothetical protein
MMAQAAIVPPAKNGGKKAKTAFGVGASTIVTIMVVLMLAVFSILAFVQSHSELRLSEMSVESLELYYNADTQAQEWLARVTALSASAGADAGAGAGADAGDIAKRLKDAGIESTEAAADGSGLAAQATFVIDEKRSLAAKALIDGTGSVRVVRWQTVTGQG